MTFKAGDEVLLRNRTKVKVIRFIMKGGGFSMELSNGGYYTLNGEFWHKGIQHSADIVENLTQTKIKNSKLGKLIYGT